MPYLCEPKPAPSVPDRGAEHDSGAEDDEAWLIERARHDHAAFAPLYRRYVGPIYGYCHHRLGAREAAEDATSLAFTKALAGLPTYRGPSFRAWLFGIAHHVVADALRVRGPDAPLDAAPDAIDRAPGPEHLALAEDDRRTLRALLSVLTKDQRAVVELRLAGLTSAEIGHALGCSRNAVDVAHHRAMDRMRRALDVAGPKGGRHDLG
jgi:RNA polymerase sigma-70 factor (ECF subfamily)